MAKSKKSTSTLKFSQRLVLNQYMLLQFGAERFNDLSKDLKNLNLEQIDSDGVTGFLPRIMQRQELLIAKDKLEEYDRNIVRHLRKINENRDTKISLKYFQYLSLLFVEYYLDMYFNNREILLEDLNDTVTAFNEQNPNDVIVPYQEDDLNKLALWNATGSGKTILMHINYYQYLYYAEKYFTDDTTIILLTPNEGLSNQHITDFEADGICAKSYDKNESRGFFTDNLIIQILENSKLADKDGDKTVAVSRFGNKNLLFVDEGHKGSSGDKWMPYRNELCKDGFSFEYSATFGQAVKAAGKDELIQQYAKCILFDYSYYYFYHDGYGKDYNIINMDDASQTWDKQKYLTACLLQYYQQKKLYLENGKNLGRFNVENPLFVFVGHTVTASNSSDDKQSISDVIEILKFFKDFSDKRSVYESYIKQIMSGNSGLLDSKQRDVFARNFVYLGTLALTEKQIYDDILSIVYNTKISGTTMNIANVKGIEGEIAITMGDNEPFGLINVGDTSELIKKLKEQSFETTTKDIGTSLFQNISSKDSTINLLIGSKKFTEGWNCWRVSTMGLMNVGKSEGSEIIQLFGRGVRLMGYNKSLKRSRAYKKLDDSSIDIPKYTDLLETLNVFGIQAKYMQEFREMLKEEGVPGGDEYLQMELPVIKNKEALKNKLKTLRLPDTLNYKKDAPKPILKLLPNLSIVQDCYTQLDQEASASGAQQFVNKDECHFSETTLAFFDYDKIWLEIENYKNEKNRYNVHIVKEELKKLLQDNTWYKILIPKNQMETNSFDNIENLQNIAISMLKKYFDKFYVSLKGSWETPRMQYVEVDENDPNFIEDDTYVVTIQNPEQNDDVKTFVENLSKNVAEAKSSGKLESLTNTSNSYLWSYSFVNSLYNPYLYINGKTTEIAVSPVALVKSEYDFVLDLKTYVTKNPDLIKDAEIFIIRNKSKKGVGFFVESGFYPDFIMWIIKDGKQYISFIDPHGMGRESIESSKVQIFNQVKELETKLADKNVVLNSFILSPTAIQNIVEKHTKEMWNENHVLFMQDEYVKEMVEGILGINGQKD